MPYPYKLRKLVKESQVNELQINELQVNEKIELISETSAFTYNEKSNIKTDSDIKKSIHIKFTRI